MYQDNCVCVHVRVCVCAGWHECMHVEKGWWYKHKYTNICISPFAMGHAGYLEKGDLTAC